MSKEILSYKFRSLTVCEKNPDRRSGFAIEASRFNNIHIFEDDLVDLAYKPYTDEVHQKYHRIAKSCSSSQVNFLIPLLPSKLEVGFLKHLYDHVALKLGLFSTSIVHYYMLMSGRQYAYLEAKAGSNFSSYRNMSVLINTLFEVSKMDSFDLKESFGISLRNIQTTSKSRKDLYKEVHLVHLNPRHAVIKAAQGKSLIEYRFLVNQLMYRRKNLALPIIEQWFGDCRDEILQFGVTPTTRSGDLDWVQYYNLHRFLRGMANYKGSLFLQAAERSEHELASIPQD